MKFGPVVQEMSFKGKVYGWTDAWQTKKDHISSPWVFGLGELKIKLYQTTSITMCKSWGGVKHKNVTKVNYIK